MACREKAKGTLSLSLSYFGVTGGLASEVLSHIQSSSKAFVAFERNDLCDVRQKRHKLRTAVFVAEHFVLVLLSGLLVDEAKLDVVNNPLLFEDHHLRRHLRLTLRFAQSHTL